MTPERLLTAFDRFTLQSQMRDVEPRVDDTWAVIDTKTADPETNWPGELVSEHPTHTEARIGLMKAIIAEATPPGVPDSLRALLLETLRFYAYEQNYHNNMPLNQGSGNFEGANRASIALAALIAAQPAGQSKSVEENARRDAERRRLEARPEPNWIDRAAWIACEIREPARTMLGDVIEDRDPEGQSGAHLLWMLEELSARRVGSETKTCRWLGYAQALAMQFGILDLEKAKQLNLRSKAEAQLIATPKTNPLPAGYGQPGAGSAAAELARIRAVVPASLLYEVDLVEAVASTFRQYVKVAAEATELRKQLAAKSFQIQCQTWLEEVVHDDPTDLAERRARFLEEALELVQSLDMSLVEVIQVAAYVFSRPAGETPQEYGGMLTTAMVLAQYTGHDLMLCGQAELERCWDPAVIEKIRGKRSRRHGRGPLPGTSAPEADLVPAPKGSTPDPFYSGCGDRTGPR